MKTEILDQLFRVSKAAHLSELQKIQPILQKEAELRASLAKLEQNSLGSEVAEDADFAMRAVGADFLWRGWITRTRTQLNIELAQTLARKMDATTSLAKSFGRQHALELIIQKQEARERGNRRKAQEAIASESFVTGSHLS
jgi:hypothetical protein